MTLRVTGGSFRGRRLETPPGGATRPTASRVREAVFSMLGPLPGARVLDLCCGCGSLGLEALSRGAEHATFVDDAAAAIEAVAANVRTVGVEEQATLLQTDLLRAVQRLGEAGERFDVIFLDPPYSRAVRLVGGIAELVPGLLEPGGRVVLEGDRRDPAALLLPLDRERAYRDVLVRIYEADAGAGAPDA